MAIMTQIPIGTKLKVFATGEIITLQEIRSFPTRFKTTNTSGMVAYYKTFEVEIIEPTDQTE